MRKEIFVLILRLTLSGVFLYAGIIKAANPEKFWIDVQNYQLLPHFGNVLVALYLPYLEILCALALWYPRWALGSVSLMGGMMLVFTIALLSAWIRGLDITCGCFGGSEKNRYIEWLVRDILLILAIAWIGREDWSKMQSN
ncbi:MAG: hypothetical protein NZM04_06830 [Methylacidiphilales bacterium]|nr:hypothetical protein [Candidatus Methylacidiphilales bacterium]MDW8349318.1 MauE/DoxX family redox-associated membrane protein [Verrucomicrobiae bacterium]